jgi:hypothetical protein
MKLSIQTKVGIAVLSAGLLAFAAALWNMRDRHVPFPRNNLPSPLVPEHVDGEPSKQADKGGYDVAGNEGIVKLAIETFREKTRKGRSKESAVAAIHAMNALLEVWTPVGKSVDEVIQVLGPPDSQADMKLAYRFDTGLAGCLWQFTLKEGRVTGIIKETMD